MPARIGDPNKRRRHFIKEWRKFRELTQEQLAEMMGTTKTSISRIEDLKQGYSQDFLEACAEALGTHPGTLLMRGPTPADLPPDQPNGRSQYAQAPSAQYAAAERSANPFKGRTPRSKPSPGRKRKAIGEGNERPRP